ncbi:BamA/TamA family outer membrane protein [bacterium]|nr:BamA/TamA family outer membrane protein [bacterium]
MRLNQSLVISLIATCFITLVVVAEEHPGMRASTCYLKKEKRDHYHYSDRRETKTISSYNRVDGLFLGMRVPYHKDYRGNGVLQLYGMVGVGIKSKAIRYRAALERGLFPYSYRFALGFEAYDLTYSEDDWIISTLENSLAAFFIHEDFQDFYRRQGYGVYLRQNFSQHLSLKVGYYEEKHSYLPLKTDWALFGGHKKFRPNPSITEGELKGILTTLCFDTRNHYKNPDQGWLATIFIEYTPKDFLNQTDDLDFKRYVIDIRRYQPLSQGQNLDLRLRLGESDATLPKQKLFDLGGISTLRGFEFKEFTGDRMLLGNLEYRVDWSEAAWKSDLFILDEVTLIFFIDSGLAWNKNTKDFQNLSWKDFHTDVGIAISNWDGSTRLNIAKPTNQNSNEVKITFRISRPF